MKSMNSLEKEWYPLKVRWKSAIIIPISILHFPIGRRSCIYIFGTLRNNCAHFVLQCCVYSVWKAQAGIAWGQEWSRGHGPDKEWSGSATLPSPVATLPSVLDSGRIMFPSLEILANTVAVSHKKLLVTIICHLVLKSWEKWQFLVSPEQ